MSQFNKVELSDIFNGRVTNIDSNTYKPSYMVNQEGGNKDFKNHAVVNLQTPTKLSELYFSKSNIQNVQNQIRYKIYTISKGQHTIGEQSDVELKIIMRSIYLQYGKYTDTNLKEQIIELNKLVLEYAVPRIFTQIQQYNTYLYDVQHLPMPMARSQNVSSAGTKNLRSVASTF